MRIIRVGIVGMGRMGRIRLEELKRHPGFEVVCYSDLKEQPELEIKFHSRWEDVLLDQIDAVFVCAFNNLIPDITCAALERGLHAFSEKPPGRNVGDILRIIAAERCSPRSVLKFGFNHRLHYAVMEAKAMIETGKYGKILWARGIYGKAGGENFLENWRADEALAGGGILLDQGIHMLDLLNHFIGGFTEIKSFVDNTYWSNSRLEDNAFALLKNDSGQYAILHSSATHWKHRFNLDITLEHGYINLNGILSSSRSYGEESITFAKRQLDTELRAKGRPREETIYFDQDHSWRLEVEEFYDCITGRKKVPTGSSKDAFEAMNLVGKIYQASHQPGLQIHPSPTSPAPDARQAL